MWTAHALPMCASGALIGTGGGRVRLRMVGRLASAPACRRMDLPGNAGAWAK